MAPLHRLVSLLIVAIVVVHLTAPAGATKDRVGTCIRNCAQCKRMFGEYFEGQRCAESCLKFKGKSIPDCEDINTIEQFIHRVDEDED
ncbi:eclosion hormone [Fopius arisanus]|uniref:Eclosion hormone n=1 Tax=Fopius arisanus TaxID=64838 RepID=A0A9R1TYK6_9HYME|nr:PREDICTED: eclosion hormone [Fopius arisanus]